MPVEGGWGAKVGWTIPREYRRWPETRPSGETREWPMDTARHETTIDWLGFSDLVTRILQPSQLQLLESRRSLTGGAAPIN